MATTITGPVFTRIFNTPTPHLRAEVQARHRADVTLSRITPIDNYANIVSSTAPTTPSAGSPRVHLRREQPALREEGKRARDPDRRRSADLLHRRERRRGRPPVPEQRLHDGLAADPLFAGCRAGPRRADDRHRRARSGPSTTRRSTRCASLAANGGLALGWVQVERRLERQPLHPGLRSPSPVAPTHYLNAATDRPQAGQRLQRHLPVQLRREEQALPQPADHRPLQLAVLRHRSRVPEVQLRHALGARRRRRRTTASTSRSRSRASARSRISSALSEGSRDDEGTDSQRRQGHAAAAADLHQRQAARAGRQQAGAVLRHRGARRRRHPRDRHRRRRHARRDSRRGRRRLALERARHLHRAGRAARPRARGAHQRAVHRPRSVRDVSRRQPAEQGDHRVRGGVRPRGAGGADPADQGARPADVRRRRAGGRPGRAAGREAEGAEERPRAGRRLHVLARGVRLGQADQAELPERARDHRRHPGPDRPRPRGPAAPGRGLVEGHRQARGHARSQPPDPRHDRAPDRRVGGRRVAHRGQGRSSRPARWSSAPSSAAPWSSARTRASSTPTSGRSPRSARARKSATRRSSTASCSKGARSRDCEPRRRQPDRAERADLPHCRSSRRPTASCWATTPRSASAGRGP